MVVVRAHFPNYGLFFCRMNTSPIRLSSPLLCVSVVLRLLDWEYLCNTIHNKRPFLVSLAHNLVNTYPTNTSIFLLPLAFHPEDTSRFLCSRVLYLTSFLIDPVGTLVLSRPSLYRYLETLGSGQNIRLMFIRHSYAVLVTSLSTHTGLDL